MQALARTLNQQADWFALGVAVAVCVTAVYCKVRRKSLRGALATASMPFLMAVGLGLLGQAALVWLGTRSGLEIYPGSRWPALWLPGLAVGALLGVGAAARWTDRGRMVDVVDELAPGIGLGFAVARYGCEVAGCCYPLTMWYIALGLAMACVAVLVGLRKHAQGEPSLAVFAFFGLVASGLEWFRLEEVEYWGPAPSLVWSYSVIGLSCLALLAWTKTKRRRSLRLA